MYNNHKMGNSKIQVGSLIDLNAHHSSILKDLPYLKDRYLGQLSSKNITLEDIDSVRKVAKALHGFKEAGNKDIGDQILLDAEMHQLAVESAYSTALFIAPTFDIQEIVKSLENAMDSMKKKMEDMERTCLATSLLVDGGTNSDSGLPRMDLESHWQAAIYKSQATANKAQATADNVHIIYLNSHLPHPYVLFPLKKVTPGSGYELALKIYDSVSTRDRLSEMDRQFHHSQHNVGSLPPSFEGQIARYTDLDILDKVIFYNDDFGIALSDLLPERVDKFRAFLSDFRKK